MNARDIIAGQLRSWPIVTTDRIVDALRADPAAVLSLLPAELLADIEMCAAEVGDAHSAHPAGDRVLDALGRVQR